jgi:hypothetical protein
VDKEGLIRVNTLKLKTLDLLGLISLPAERAIHFSHRRIGSLGRTTACLVGWPGWGERCAWFRWLARLEVFECCSTKSKSHHDVYEIFFQIVSKSFMEDGNVCYIDSQTRLRLLTTNTGTKWIASLYKDPELMPEPNEIANSMREPLPKVFSPALSGRLATIPYYPLIDAMPRQIVRRQLNRIKQRVDARYKMPFEYTEDVVKLAAQRCTERECGGRMVDAILANTILPDISREIFRRILRGSRSPWSKKRGTLQLSSRGEISPTGSPDRPLWPAPCAQHSEEIHAVHSESL